MTAAGRGGQLACIWTIRVGRLSYLSGGGRVASTELSSGVDVAGSAAAFLRGRKVIRVGIHLEKFCCAFQSKTNTHEKKKQ